MMDQRLPKEAVWDALLYAAAPYAGKKELEEYYAADPNVVMPEKARKRMNLRLRRERKYREAHETYRPVLVTVQRILVVVATLLAVTLLMFLPSEKVREAMWDTVVEWGEESILVSFVGGDMEGVPTEILEYREPRAIGEEFEKNILKKTIYKYYAEYIDGDRIIRYEQNAITKNNIYISNENTIGVRISVNGHNGVFNTFNIHGMIFFSVSFTDGEYGYTVCSNLSLDELLSIAESIK